MKDPLSGKRKKVERPRDEWVVQQREEMRIISDETLPAADQRWREIDGVFPSKHGSRKGKEGKRGYQGKTKSYVKSHPKHLLSGSLRQLRRGHRPLEWQGQRLLRLHERLAGLRWWTRLRPIRTVAEVGLDVAIFVAEPSRYLQIQADARRMRGLGMKMA